MRKVWPILPAILFAVSLAGCISVETTVKLNRDGSGQIIERIGIGKGMADFASKMSGGADEEQEAEPFDKEQFEKTAKDFGEGVRFVSMSESEDQNMKYYEAVYAFDDINKVGIDQNRGNRASTRNDQGKPGKKEPVRFKFTPGEDYSTLKIQLPETHDDDFEESPPEQMDVSPEMQEAGAQMMKMMLKGMHFAVRIDCNGEIVETNATNADKNSVTLLDVNFDTIMDNAEKLAELNAKKPEGIEEVKEILKDVKGLKFEMREKVTIRFK